MAQIASPLRSDAPPMFCNAGDDLNSVTGHWVVLHTKARNEKALAWELHDLNMAYFLPLLRQNRIYGRRKTQIATPLFKGYVFVAVNAPEDRYRVQSTHRVANLIEVRNQDRFRFELEQVRRAVTSPHQLELFPGVVCGRRCRIISGALQGVEGKVVLRKETGRVHLEVSMLGQSAVLDVEISQIEMLD